MFRNVAFLEKTDYFCNRNILFYKAPSRKMNVWRGTDTHSFRFVLTC